MATRDHVMATRDRTGTAVTKGEGAIFGTSVVYPGSGNLVEHGGPEMATPSVKAIYWNSAVANSTSTSLGYSTIQSQVNGFVNTFSDAVNWRDTATADYTIVQQYGRATSISNRLGNLGALVENQATVSTISDTAIRNHLAALFGNGTVPVSPDVIYSMFFPPNMQVTAGTEISGVDFCAYHWDFYYGGIPIKYAVFPYPGTDGCMDPSISSAAADFVTVLMSHEIRETVTNPTGGGWYDISGNEADDKCAWSHLYRTANGGFLVQPEWSNGGTVTASGFTATYPGPGCVVPSNPPKPPHQLTIATLGSGIVYSADSTIYCPGSSCTHTYPFGTSVGLHYGPSSGHVFAGWSSPDCSSGTAVMTADRTCTAVFLPYFSGFRPGSLTLSSSGNGDVFTYDVKTGARASELSDGQGHFGELRAAWSAGWQISAADFNGDGFTDFFLYNPATGAWYKALSNGSLDFTYFSGQWGAGWRVFVLDLNGDHHSDVFVYNPTTGDWYRCVSVGDGTGDFAYVSGHWSAGWQIYPADLNGDGKADLFLYHPTFGWWYQVVNDGTNFAYTFGQWSAGWAITPGDFNGDGKTDFFLSNPSSGEWYVAITLSPSTFSYGHGFWSTGWTFTPGDFNGDGKVDLFLYNPATGWWYEAVSNGAGGFGLTFGTWGANWDVHASDLNGDGRTDLVLYNPATGQWYQALTTGVGTFSYNFGWWNPGLTVITTVPRTP